MQDMLVPEEKEIYRYLGLKGSEPDEQMQRAVRDCLEKLIPQLEPRQVHRFFPLEDAGEETFLIEGIRIRSHSLARSLKGCRHVCLMAATIGMAPDRMTDRAGAARKMSEALIIQAAGTALIETWCDKVNDQIRREAAEKGLYTRPRFSPGYGDFALAHQEDFFRLLGVQKRIGVTLTDSLLMLPAKSVTALIGLSETDTGCILKGCENCTKAAECSYRR